METYQVRYATADGGLGRVQAGRLGLALAVSSRLLARPEVLRVEIYTRAGRLAVDAEAVRTMVRSKFSGSAPR